MKTTTAEEKYLRLIAMGRTREQIRCVAVGRGDTELKAYLESAKQDTALEDMFK